MADKVLRSTGLAKISPPKLVNLFPRDRLFQRLSETSDQPCTWICAPGGYGKTSLVADYIHSRNIASLWYQLDTHDSDIANFFHYLKQAVECAHPEINLLPVFSLEYAGGEEKFAQNVFHALSELFGSPLYLVLDNYQELSFDSPLHQILAKNLSNLPSGLHIVVNSREIPPPVYAKCIANDHVAVVGQNELRLSKDESAEICRLKMADNLSTAQLTDIHEMTQGWVSALVLILRNYQLTGVINTVPENVFDYFAEEVMSETDVELRTFLLLSSFFPEMTGAMTDELTGQSKSKGILDKLSRNNYFTTRSSANKAVYKYHSLFREFLNRQANQYFSQAEIVDIKKRSATILEKHGNYEAAIELMVEIQEWSALSELASTKAQDLFLQGRVQIIERWLKKTPEKVRLQNPWLQYWYGMSGIHYQPATARDILAVAYESFKTVNDSAGLILTWASVIDTFIYEWGDFSKLDFWIAEAEPLKKLKPEAFGPEVSARFTFAMFTALMYRQPDHPEMEHWVESTSQLLQLTPDMRMRVMIGHQLAFYYTWWRGDMGGTAMVLEWLRPVADMPDISPMIRIVWYCIRANYATVIGDADTCLSEAYKGLKLSTENGVHVWDFMLYSQLVWGSLIKGDSEKVEQFIKKMSDVTDQSRLMNVCIFHDNASIVSVRQGDIVRATAHNKTAQDYAVKTGMPFAQAMCAITRARIVALQGDYLAAENYLSEAVSFGERMNSEFIRFLCLLLKAVFEMEQALPGFTQTLEKAMSIGCKHRFYSHMWISAEILSRLCNVALENNIETAYVKEVIRKHRLSPETDRISANSWSWPVRVNALGEFTVYLLDADSYIDKAKHRKPLQLLQAIIALGGQDVPRKRLIEIFWPDAIERAAEHTLTTNLYRLRKLLLSELAFNLEEGYVSLNKDHCWLDSYALKTCLTEIEQLLSTSNLKAVLNERLAYLGDMLFSLYQGKLFQSRDESWLLTAQERLHQTCIRTIKKLGAFWLKHADWERALECYAQAESHEPLCEEFYQQQMICLRELDRPAEAMLVYRRCHRNLSKGLQLAPSTRTERIRHSLVNQSSSA